MEALNKLGRGASLLYAASRTRIVITRQIDGVSFLEFPNLSDRFGVKHGVFTKNFGKSSNPYRSLNVSFGVGDNDLNVIQNRNIIARCLAETDLVFMDQVHGTRVMVITRDNQSARLHETVFCVENDLQKNITEPIGGFDSSAERKMVGDAVVTDIPKKFLVVQVADCQSILLYDPARRVVANVHSGWRGSIDNIIGRTVNVMETCFGCLSIDMIAGIGPSLGPCCSEFVNYEKEIPKKYWKYMDGNTCFDFWSVSLDQLCEAGVLAQNISLSRICTKCDSDRFFSFRGEGATGRFASVIGLK